MKTHFIIIAIFWFASISNANIISDKQPLVAKTEIKSKLIEAPFWFENDIIDIVEKIRCMLSDDITLIDDLFVPLIDSETYGFNATIQKLHVYHLNKFNLTKGTVGGIIPSNLQLAFEFDELNIVIDYAGSLRVLDRTNTNNGTLSVNIKTLQFGVQADINILSLSVTQVVPSININAIDMTIIDSNEDWSNSAQALIDYYLNSNYLLKIVDFINTFDYKTLSDILVEIINGILHGNGSI